MNHLGVFAKFWRPRAVKTRLGSEIGYDAAADLYREMLLVTLRRIAAVGDVRSLVFDPPERANEFAEVAGNCWRCEVQAEGDLGKRMAAFAQGALTDGAKRVVILGTDCPHLPISCVLEAFELLVEVDVVLGPATDGGYYLAAMRNHVPPIFDNIPWSSRDVFAQTVARLAASDLSFAVLNETFDVDDVASVRLLDEHLRQQGDVHREFAELAAQVARIVMNS